MTPFIQGYIEAVLRDVAYFGLILHPSVSDIHPESLSLIENDCVEPRWVGNCNDSFKQLKGSHFWKERQHGWYDESPPLAITLGADGKIRLLRKFK